MTWSFTGVVDPVQAEYNQGLGFSPDVAVLRFNPQVTALPTSGTLTLTWDVTTITLPNCVVDLGSMRYTDDGFYMMLKVLDRRERWTRAAPISGEYNTIRVGTKARARTLRQLATLLFTALGEATANVSALPTDIYPPVSWRCDDVVEVLEALLTEYGYSVALGFGSESVTVVKLGTGATLSTTDMFVGSATIDPKLAPRYMRNCFGDSVAQVRLKMEAVGLDTDGSWKLIDSLSFKPAAGWERVAPYSLNEATVALTADQKVEAAAYVRSAYRVKGFADGTWDVPDGSETLTSLDQILPIEGRLLSTEDFRPDETYENLRVYGKYFQMPDEKAQPFVGGNTVIGDKVTGRRYRFDGENGMLFFEEPIYYMDGSDIKPADLWIEVTIRIRNSTNGSWRHYEYDVDAEPTGTGYYTIRHEDRAETIVSYDTSHGITAFSTNAASLIALGVAAASAAAGMFATSASQYIAYNQPKLMLRCDGAIQQVKHIMTCGEHEHAVNRTTASRNFEFDKKVPSRAQRVAHLRAMKSAVHIQRSKVYETKLRDGND
jgi:hypothetical protein